MENTEVFEAAPAVEAPEEPPKRGRGRPKGSGKNQRLAALRAPGATGDGVLSRLPVGPPVACATTAAEWGLAIATKDRLNIIRTGQPREVENLLPTYLITGMVVAIGPRADLEALSSIVARANIA